ncbi:MAG: hypothetical protein N3A53_03260 [Verrucomicrobiae bacterium]|nr:hypothetical protein [Verrucomicrobiae bacterium]
MSDVVVLPLRERAVRWLMLLASVALHGAALGVFRLHGEVDVPRFRERTRLQAVVPSLERADRLQPTLTPAELFDSSLMALPSGPGFSGRLWQRGLPPTRRLAELPLDPVPLEPPPTPQWMALAPAVPLADVVKTRPLPREAWLEEPEEAPSPAAAPATVSVYRISGPLAGRVVRWAPSLPVLAQPVVVRATVLRVAVDAEGAVRHVVRERGSGNDQADELAEQWVRRVRWEPLGEDVASTEWTWGVVRILWAVAPAAGGEAGPP